MKIIYFIILCKFDKSCQTINIIFLFLSIIFTVTCLKKVKKKSFSNDNLAIVKCIMHQ